MRLLSDSDIFCKLGAIGLLDEAAKLLGGDSAKIERLTALPIMLRRERSKLRQQYGATTADALAARAEQLPVVPLPPLEFADLLVDKADIDAGEVQLLALAAADTLLLMSGDKRAMTAVARQVPQLLPHLAGKIVCLEAVLLALCLKLGVERVFAAVEPYRAIDGVFKTCFSNRTETMAGLESYLHSLSGTVAPLVLWSPIGGAE